MDLQEKLKQIENQYIEVGDKEKSFTCNGKCDKCSVSFCLEYQRIERDKREEDFIWSVSKNRLPSKIDKEGIKHFIAVLQNRLDSSNVKKTKFRR